MSRISGLSRAWQGFGKKPLGAPVGCWTDTVRPRSEACVTCTGRTGRGWEGRLRPFRNSRLYSFCDGSAGMCWWGNDRPTNAGRKVGLSVGTVGLPSDWLHPPLPFVRRRAGREASASGCHPVVALAALLPVALPPHGQDVWRRRRLLGRQPWRLPDSSMKGRAASHWRCPDPQPTARPRKSPFAPTCRVLNADGQI